MMILFLKEYKNCQKEENAMMHSEIKEEVWQTIKTINHLWSEEKNAEALRYYFHRDMVLIIPQNREIIEGVEAIISSYKNYLQAIKIHYFKELDPKIQIFGYGNLVVATYYYDMEAEINKQIIKPQGRDMYTFVKENEKWLAVANQFSPFPK